MAKMYDGAPNHISLPYLHNTTTLVPNSPHKDEIEIRKPAPTKQKLLLQPPNSTPLKPTPHPTKKTNDSKPKILNIFSHCPYKNNSQNIKHFPTHTPQKTTPKTQIFPTHAPQKTIPKISSISLHKPYKKQLQNIKHFPTQTPQNDQTKNANFPYTLSKKQLLQKYKNHNVSPRPKISLILP